MDRQSVVPPNLEADPAAALAREALALRGAGRHDDAAARYAQAARAARSARGEGEDSIAAEIFAGTERFHAGHVEAATDQMRDALRVAEAVLGEHHRLATGARHNLSVMTTEA